MNLNINKGKRKMENKYYIYCYMDPRRSGKYYYENIEICFLYEPFYIGRGCGDRYLDHLKEVLKNKKAYNRIKSGKISNILKCNLSPFISFLELNIDKCIANIKEIYYIRNIGRVDLNTGPLSNLSSGGEGGILDMSDSLRNHFSNLFTGSGNPMFGVSRYGCENPFFNKSHSIETKLKIGLKNIGREPWNKGKSHPSISGCKNKNVIDYKIISPTGEEIIIKSCYLNIFCEENKLSERNFKRYKNKGKIPPYKQGKDLPERINSTGWELISIS